MRLARHEGRATATTKSWRAQGLPAEYNDDDFWPRHFLAEIKRSQEGYRIQPGTEAPNLEFERSPSRRTDRRVLASESVPVTPARRASLFEWARGDLNPHVLSDTRT